MEKISLENFEISLKRWEFISSGAYKNHIILYVLALKHFKNPN